MDQRDVVEMGNKYDFFDLRKIKLTKNLFFTGPGGVGKTSTACAVAVKMADSGNLLAIPWFQDASVGNILSIDEKL